MEMAKGREEPDRRTKVGSSTVEIAALSPTEEKLGESRGVRASTKAKRRNGQGERRKAERFRRILELKQEQFWKELVGLAKVFREGMGPGGILLQETSVKKAEEGEKKKRKEVSFRAGHV